MKRPMNRDVRRIEQSGHRRTQNKNVSRQGDEKRRDTTPMCCCLAARNLSRSGRRMYSAQIVACDNGGRLISQHGLPTAQFLPTQRTWQRTIHCRSACSSGMHTRQPPGPDSQRSSVLCRLRKFSVPFPSSPLDMSASGCTLPDNGRNMTGMILSRSWQIVKNSAPKTRGELACSPRAQ